MKIFTLGSKVFDDAIRYTKEREIINSIRVTNISPFSVGFNMGRNLKPINKELFQNAYIKNVVNFEITGGVLPEKDDYEVIVLDLLDARLEFEEIELDDGTKYRISITNYVNAKLEEIIKEINGERKVLNRKREKPLLFSNERLENEIIQYANFLRNFANVKKCVLLDIKLPLEYISYEEEICLFKEFQGKVAYNAFFDRCVDIFRKECDCSVVLSPSKIIGDEKLGAQSMFCFSSEYYDYLICSVKAILSVDECIMNNYELLLKRRLGCINLRKMMAEKNRRYFCVNEIVLLGDINVFTDDILKNLELSLLKVINYTKDTTEAEIEQKVRELCDLESILLLIPEIYDAKLLHVIKNIANSPRIEYICPVHKPRYLNKFKGVYKDLFNNYIRCDEVNDIEVTGSANIIQISGTSDLDIIVDNCNSISIATNVKVLKAVETLKIYMQDSSMLEIGNGCTFGNACRIETGNFGKISIGTDCMFSAEIVVKCDLPFRNMENNSICLCDHVWVGLRNYLLSGTYVGCGSVIGARSVTSAIYGNNCIIVGNPARVVKQNIAWHRSREEDIFEEIEHAYRNYTK